MLIESVARVRVDESAEATPVVLLNVARDDVSLLISSFREALEAAHRRPGFWIGMGVMPSDVQRSLAAILNSDLDSEVGGHPAARILRVFIPFGERAVVEARARQVGQEADLSKSGGMLRIVATRNRLSIALACAKKMRSYVGPEEMHSITGFDPDEVDDFIDSLSRCVSDSADD